VRYYAGSSRNGGPSWSVREEDAVPLFYPSAIGELSVRWNAALERWVLMYCSGPEDPIGFAVVMRVARHPWGPWSRRRLMLDIWLDALGHREGADGLRRKDCWFSHDGAANPPDGLGDDIIGDRGGDGTGGAYAPYQLARHARHTRAAVTFYYLLSTWNPYQVAQMQHQLTFREFAELGG
jgi:Domain of unknown function (DUF4185)